MIDVEGWPAELKKPWNKILKQGPPLKHYAKWKGDHIAYDSMYTICPKEANI